MTPDQQVFQTLQDWAKAMIAKDAAALDKILHPEIVYSHSNCKAESKADILGKLNRTGGAQKIEFLDPRTRVAGSTAYVRTGVEYTNRSEDGEDSLNHLNVLHVFVQEDGHWRMFARQATRKP